MAKTICYLVSTVFQWIFDIVVNVKSLASIIYFESERLFFGYFFIICNRVVTRAKENVFIHLFFANCISETPK